MFRITNLPNVICFALLALLMLWAAVLPAKSEEYVLLGKHELPHDWHLTLVGPPGGPVTSCGMQSPFDSPGTELVAKGVEVTLMVIADGTDAKDHFDLVILSPSWNFPEGFTATLRFTWNQGESDQTVYRLDAKRWATSNGVMVGVTREFVIDLGKNKSFDVSAGSGKEIGSFPLIGSMNAMEVLLTCEATLSRSSTGSAPKDLGDYLKDRL